MKLRITVILIAAILAFQSQISSCHSKAKYQTTGASAVKDYFFSQTDSLTLSLRALDSLAGMHKPVNILQLQFANCRFRYKKIECVVEYYFQGLTKRINGPALPDVKTEDGVVWPPHGFQMIEQFLYDAYSDTLQPLLSKEINALKGDLLFVKNNMQDISITANHVQDILQHQFIRIAVLGIAGFDAPLSKLSLPEASNSLYGIKKIAALYQGKETEAQQNLFALAVQYLDENTDFDSFNRLDFLTNYLMPLSDAYASITGFDAKTDSLLTKPFKGTLSQLLQGKNFNADFYSPYAVAKSNAAKIEMGKQLFFDKSLSKSGTISCGSCHQPELYFTDGKEKAGNFVHGGSLLRNTPSLYYAAMQSHQFYDLRSQSLEDQAHEVMKNNDEFNLSSTDIAKKISTNKEYTLLIKKAFLGSDTLSGFEVRNALATFVRSLSPFSSSFDAYLKGDKTALTAQQVQGFNLFAGKAKCATCHFIPLLNGNIPPWYTKSESEIIGVPASLAWKNAVIDKDSGRYAINQLKELRFAFKTPTIRNAEKTAPYMHNGVYKTLDEVVEFYHVGGGVGIGIELPFQSLPFDSLTLNKNEKKAIISFIKSLTDKKPVY